MTSNKKAIYCTYFDKNYLLKGLCLISSFYKYHKNYEFWVLCFDDYTFEILNKLKIAHVKSLRLGDFEEFNPELVKIKMNRQMVEYYWTATPYLPLFIFNKNKDIRYVVYLDSDLFFYSKMDLAFEELGDGSIYSVEHRFAPNERYRILTSGRFNVGFQIYRNDKQAIGCLERWGKQCLAWCSQRPKKGKYGDQVYLNDWPKFYPNLVISQNLGIDAAPWNIGQYQVTRKNGKIYISNDELICFHFHQFEILAEDRFEYCFGHRLSSQVKEYIYEPYISEVKKQVSFLKKIDKDFRVVSIKKSYPRRLKEAMIKMLGPIYWQAMTAVKGR